MLAFITYIDRIKYKNYKEIFILNSINEFSKILGGVFTNIAELGQ